jgi:hypothetical protein
MLSPTQLKKRVNQRRKRLRFRENLIQHVEQVSWLIHQTNINEDFYIHLESLQLSNAPENEVEACVCTHIVRLCRQIGIPIHTIFEMKELIHLLNDKPIVELPAKPPFSLFSDIIITLWRGWHHITAAKREQTAKHHMQHVLKNKLQFKLLQQSIANGTEMQHNIFYIEEDLHDQSEFVPFTPLDSKKCVQSLHEWIDHGHRLFWAFTEHSEFFFKENVKICHNHCVSYEKTLTVGKRYLPERFSTFWASIFENQDKGCVKIHSGIDLHLFLEHIRQFEAIHRAFSHSAVM